ncbi:hypothetical protein Ancab_009150 [Ancistrocladus abbreviatus]
MVQATVTRNLKQFTKLPTVGLWNTQIREAINDDYPRKALSLYRQMKQKGVEPNKLTFPFVAKAGAKLSNLKQSQMIHAHVLKSPFSSDVFVGTAIMDMYVKCDHLDSAYNVFEEMPVRDVTLWNVMLLGFAHSGLVDRFFGVFAQMRLEGVHPDAVTIIGLTQAVIEFQDLYLVQAVHSVAIRFGMLDDASLANTIISAYGKSGDLAMAKDVFEMIDLDFKTVVSWNSLIAGYALSGNYWRVVDLYKWMCHYGFRPDISTFVSLFSSCVQPEALIYGRLVHCHVIQSGFDADICVVNTTIAMYSKCGDIDLARQLFEKISSKTCVSWTIMIAVYAEKGNLDEALTLFSNMEAAGEKPDAVTVVSLMSGCGQAGSLEVGRWLENYALSKGLEHSIALCNAAIDMYAKCGCIRDARRVFYCMPQKTVVSWTTMIAGCALNGEFMEALNLFSEMIELGLKPNHITFLAVLQACTHAGFLEKGWECFDLMTNVYGITPALEHYSCIIDLLGRRGNVKQALVLIKKMPVKPDAGIWGTLLNACKIHHNVEIGEYAAHCLSELEPDTAVSYVEMANMYASAERWEGVSRVRALMKCKGIKKSPGQSLVELNGKNHRFGVEERCHPECLRIYEVLNILALHLRKEGFSANSERFLQDEVQLQ